jgi:hypothetical protein
VGEYALTVKTWSWDHSGSKSVEQPSDWVLILKSIETLLLLQWLIRDAKVMVALQIHHFSNGFEAQ